MKHRQILSVIILTYNNEKNIRTCITSLKKRLAEIDLGSEIIVVDNDSRDSTTNKLRGEKKIKLLRLYENTGFAKGINNGIKLAKGDMFLILNPDTRLYKNALKNLYRCMVKSRAGIAGGLSYRQDKTIHGSYVRKPDLFTLLFDYSNLRKMVPWDMVHKRHYYHDMGAPRKQVYVDIVSGSFMMIDKKVINKIGYFDENFFMYLEDVDFCVRASDEGVKIAYCPKSKIFHEGGSSSKNKDRILHSAWDKSRRYYSKKHFSVLTNIFVQPVFALDNLLSETWRKIKSQ